MANKTKRKALIMKMLEKMYQRPQFLGFLWPSDEAHFHLEGNINFENNIFWRREKPEEVAKKQVHSAKSSVWATLSEKISSVPSSSKNMDLT